jgi:ActR/RegA family two-component response regulator
MPDKKRLLAVIELGGYPDFRSLYERVGYEVSVASSVRNALRLMKKAPPDAVVAEFNFQSDFRDRTSSLESLLAMVRRRPDTRIVIFYEREYAPQLERLRVTAPPFTALAYPIDADELERCLLQPPA